MSFQSQAQHGWFQSQFVYKSFRDPAVIEELLGVHPSMILHKREETNKTEPMNEELIPSQDCCNEVARKTTMLEELQSKRNWRARQLEELDGAIAALSANPALADTLEAVRRALRQ